MCYVEYDRGRCRAISWLSGPKYHHTDDIGSEFECPPRLAEAGELLERAG